MDQVEASKYRLSPLIHQVNLMADIEQVRNKKKPFNLR